MWNRITFALWPLIPCSTWGFWKTLKKGRWETMRKQGVFAPSFILFAGGKFPEKEICDCDCDC